MSRAGLVLVFFAAMAACHRDASLAPYELPAPKRTMSFPAPPDPDEWVDEDVGGFGAIETRSAAGDPGHLSLASVHVTASQAGDYADVRVEHHFSTDGEVPIEGTFRFPLPDGAIVTGLSMVVGGKTMEGELVDSAKARKIYQEIVDQMQDPAIMEWDHGSTFKMRVFPIEPGVDKIVTLRYLAPLRAHRGAESYVQGTRAIDGSPTLASLAITWNGKDAFAGKNVARGRRIVLTAAPAASAFVEHRDDATYQAVKVRPDWASLPAATTPPPRRFVVVVDTSRSALEERALTLASLRTVLGGLGSDASFLVATSDLDTRLDPAGWQKPTPATIDAAVRFVEALSPDGATDLGAMLRVAGAAAQGQERPAIVYLGDCEASWGEVDEARLTEAAAKMGVPVYPLLIGDSVDLELARALASSSAGRAARAQRPAEVQRFVTALGRPSRRLTGVAIEPIAGATIITDGASTLDEAESLAVFVSTPAASAPVTALTVRGRIAGRDVSFQAPIHAAPATEVARRFGASLVAALQREGKPKEDIIAASLKYTVISKHTAFLVLDSDEAYERYGIERHAQDANRVDGEAPHVDSLDGERADISADRIQPGDPEIEIDAPRDAERVFVVLPNGDLKVASWDDQAAHGRGAWMVRFLIENGTPEGTYQARVYIELADGRSETRTVPYTVDTSAPTMVARLHARRDGSFDVDVRQHVGHGGTVDLSRVEALTPDGQKIALTALRWGRFHGHFKPTRPVSGESLHLVGVDQALNDAAIDVSLP